MLFTSAACCLCAPSTTACCSSCFCSLDLPHSHRLTFVTHMGAGNMADGYRVYCSIISLRCVDGVTRRMRLSRVIYPCDILEGYKLLNVRPWTRRSTTRSDLYTMAAPDQFDEPDPQPPPPRRTQQAMSQVSSHNEHPMRAPALVRADSC